MSKWIDADAVAKILEEYMCMFPNCYVAEKMSKAPSIDIVRCKECKHNEYCCRHISADGRKADDFCSYGERRE